MTFLLPKISKILSSSCGVKCLLFDAFTKSNIASLIPHSQLLDNDFFLFDDIQNPRTKININCVCVINISSFKTLIKEISSPSFRSYTVLFTSYIDPFLLNLLAKNDIYGVIENIYELNMNFCKQDYNSFTVSKLSDFVCSLGSIPTIFTLKSIEKYTIEDMQTIQSEGGRVFILDRSYDEITPLVIDWHYQAMIKRYCQYDSYIVTINNVKYNIEDGFFKNNKFKDISTVSTNLENLVKELELKKKIKKVNIKEIEEINRLTDIVTKHLKIYNYIVDNLEEKKKQSEEEMNFLKKYKSYRSLSSAFSVEKNDLKKIQKLNDLYNVLSKNNTSFDIKKHEDIKLAYLPPIRKILKNILKNNLKDWICTQEKNHQETYTLFYFKNGVTYTEYRYIMELFDYKDNVYIISERII